MRAVPALLLALLFFATFVAAPASAQEASPTAGDVPAPAECTVEPRSVDDLRALLLEAAATPASGDSLLASPTAAAAAGEPADEQTVAEVNAAWRVFVACVNAGDYLRLFALVTDDELRRGFADDVATAEGADDLAAFFSATPVARDPEFRGPFVPLTDVRLLPDGRVSAVSPGADGGGEGLIFVSVGGRWLLDGQFELQPEGAAGDDGEDN